MKTLTPALALGCAALAAASLAACNQSTQSPPAAAASPDVTAEAAPPPPTPPPVPRYNRTAAHETRSRQYLVAQRAYKDALAGASTQGRAQQYAADAGSQASAFNARHQVQGHID